ncbi:MAG: topoisomerase DNA-binding C4 zinc finger domain-containing protein [Phycisphaeraceae bacterium]|nr:type I DNA topoisomerase [Phycisphaerae bacterium]MBX3392183.1 topoisomerase DNA-binding C4 zinc finger domain-containing protein [Phycisphaeraceae bacterium]
MAKRTSSSVEASRNSPPDRGSRAGRGSGFRSFSYTAGAAKGKDLVIVESPAKAKTINKYLGSGYLVMASVGHVRDLPSKGPKKPPGAKKAARKSDGAPAVRAVRSPVPGVDLEHDFKPTYEVLPGKEKVVSDLKKAAKDAMTTGGNVWFATDLDREGEAIAWHLAQELGIESSAARRVIFPAITKAEIEKAFQNPHAIDEDRVNAQQARRIVDRIVGYQVSPLLWKKVARGLSAGRVQSVAVRLVVEREREIRAFVPDENWQVVADFALDVSDAFRLAPEWAAFLQHRDEKGHPPTLKSQNAWLAGQGGFRAELVQVGGEKFDLTTPGRVGSSAGGPDRFAMPMSADRTADVAAIAHAAGLTGIKGTVTEDPDGRGPARWRRNVTGVIDPATPYRIGSIETRRTTQRAPGPFITSTLQQSAANRLGFGAQRTMRAAQQLYEGVEIPGEGPVGLITYMRTDSTHLSGEAIDMVRSYISRTYGERYLPEKPNFFSSSNKAAQEAHEAIRPTSMNHPPERVRSSLSADQCRLYQLVWERFVACQMAPSQWDATTVLIMGGRGGTAPDGRSIGELTFKATGRTLVFDGFHKVTGLPHAADEQTLPALSEGRALSPFGLGVHQKFTSPPPRYTEASLIKTLESEGIGRPSTYASIIGVIQERNYVEQIQRRFLATDLGEVVTDKLVEAFPEIMDVGYTRDMEGLLDKIEEEHLDWVDMLRRFYGPFKKSLAHAMETLTHAKAETVPAPEAYTCPKCEKEGRGRTSLVYRFGKNGRFLSCSRYPECDYASPVDREGKPRPAADTVDVACPKCAGAMTRRTGRFGPFLGCSRYGDKSSPCDGILNIDKKGYVVAPSPPALLTELPCPTCEAPMNLRGGLRGPWLGCSRFPKCRGRGKWGELDDQKRQALEKALFEHEKANPVLVVRTLGGAALTDSRGKPLPTAPTVDVLAGKTASAEAGADETLESIADEIGVS